MPHLYIAVALTGTSSSSRNISGTQTRIPGFHKLLTFFQALKHIILQFSTEAFNLNSSTQGIFEIGYMCVTVSEPPPPPKLIVLDYCLKSHAWAENSLLCIVIASISYCNVTGSKQCIAGLEWTKLVTRSIRALVTHSLQPLGAYNYMCICSELTTASTSPHATWVKWSFSCGLCS